MNRKVIVRKIARAMPHTLKQLRGKLMLETLCESLGVEEVACPACDGSGLLDAVLLERCPICCGFLEVPEPLAAWFKARFPCDTQGRAAARAPESLRRQHRPALLHVEPGPGRAQVPHGACLPLALAETQ